MTDMDHLWLRLGEAAADLAQSGQTPTLDQARDMVSRILDGTAPARGSAALDYLANELIARVTELRRPDGD